MKSTLAIMYFPFLLLKVVFDKYFYFMFMKALPEFTFLCHMCAWCHRDQKLVSDLMGLKLLMVVNQHLRAKIKSWFSVRIASVINPSL